MRRNPGLVGCAWLCAAALQAAADGTGGGASKDPVFDFQAIREGPLEARVLRSAEASLSARPDDPLQVAVYGASEVKTIVTEEIEYTAERTDGKPVRIFGILAYPKGGTNLPAVFWSQGGMAPASPYWPQIWAAKGYLCLNVTLPHDVYDSFTRFTTERPEDGNLARLAVAQMRGITYLTRRPEVDAERIGMGGTSYGGLFASLIAGADERVKAGISFFTTGNHALGSNYPQFTRLRTTDEAGIWSGTIDPAWRLKRRAIPFFWGVAANDHWMHLPAAVKTFDEAVGDKRLAIAPNWFHAFPEHFDRALVDWFDVYLKGSREPYNRPSDIRIRIESGQLIAEWGWTGTNRVLGAEALVAYGRTRPWHDGWLYRYHHAIPARIAGNGASAAIPLPEEGMECLLYGNIRDEHGAVVSTSPLVVRPEDVKGVVRTQLVLNTALLSDFSDEELGFFARHGESPAGVADRSEKQGGGQSLRIDPAAGGGPAAFEVRLGHVPNRGHRLSLWIRASRPASVTVAVKSVPPANWNAPIVDLLRRQYPDSPRIGSADLKSVVYETAAAADPAWRECVLDCPLGDMPVEGYRLRVSSPDPIPFWIDSIRFEPRWKEASR